MGIFDFLKKNPAGSHFSNHENTEKKQAGCSVAPIILSGSYEATVYVYDPTPLKGIKVGEEFTVRVINNRVIIKSKLTNSVFDTSDGGTAVSYKGVAFGGLGTGLWEIGKIASESKRPIEIRAKMIGTYASGCPSIVTLTPEPHDIWNWWRIQKYRDEEVPIDTESILKFREKEQHEKDLRKLRELTGKHIDSFNEYVVIYVNENDWSGPINNPGPCEVVVETMYIPTKAGSKAKPHISVVGNGVQLLDCSANRKAYEVISRHIGDRPKLASYVKEVSQKDDKTVFWKLVLIY